DKDQREEIAIRLLPAASGSARLACLDGGPLPELVSFRILPPPIMGDDREWHPDLDQDALLKGDHAVLKGRLRDGVVVGPLGSGSYAVAVRPEGFDRWTFVPGTEDPSRALPVTLEEGQTTDLGVLYIDCGPTIAVVPEVMTGAPLPDLRDS